MIEGVLSRVDIDFKLPRVDEYDPKLILGLDVKPKAYPGFSTSQHIAKFRKESSRYTKSYAYKYCQRIMCNERQILDTSLIVVGGREKRVKYNVDEKGKEVRTRVTCMMEDVPTLISQSLVNPITNCIPEIEANFCQLAKVYGQGNMINYKEIMQPRS
jgi:cellulose synthase/poly-beta-1,6-N-acetylglucosamine synthase-like glycosyltransferase